MPIVRLLLGVGAAVLFHLLGAHLFPVFPRYVDLFLVVVALQGLSGSTLSSLLVGLAVGLLQDTFTGGLYGLYGFADTIVGYGTARLAQRLVIQRASGVFTVVSFVAMLQQAVLVALAFLLLTDPELPQPLWVAVKALVCGAIGLLVYVVAGEWSRKYESRRRSRLSRLRLD